MGHKYSPRGWGKIKTDMCDAKMCSKKRSNEGIGSYGQLHDIWRIHKKDAKASKSKGSKWAEVKAAGQQKHRQQASSSQGSKGAEVQAAGEQK